MGMDVAVSDLMSNFSSCRFVIFLNYLKSLKIKVTRVTSRLQLRKKM